MPLAMSHHASHPRFLFPGACRAALCAVAALAILGGSAGGVAAESGTGYRDFTFKRVKPPSAGVKKRINVQIDPSVDPFSVTGPIARKPAAKDGETRSPAAIAAAPVPAAPPKGALGWYWSHVSPSGAGASGLDRALAALAAGPRGGEVPAPRLSNLQRIAEAHGPEILKATIGTRVSPALVLAVIAVESSGKTGAVSHAGAGGLMQLMPATAERFGVADRFDAPQNIRGGVTYLDWLLGEFGGDPVLALAGYNAGENAVKRHEGVPPFAETRDYVPKVLAAFAVARGLCVTPPQLVSDGCVFVGPRVADGGTAANG